MQSNSRWLGRNSQGNLRETFIFFFGVRLNSVSTICPLHALIPDLQNANSIKLLSHKEVVKIIHIGDGEIFRGHKWV